jgi:hypothetical protein
MDISDAKVIVKKQQLKSTARLVQNVMIKERYQCVRKGKQIHFGCIGQLCPNNTSEYLLISGGSW